MRFLPTRVHGILDYVVGGLLIVLPFLMGFGRGPQTWVPVALGAGALLYSLFTNYELGAVRLIGMPAHLILDAGSGLFLAASPWLFGFASAVWAPHVIFGLFEIGAAAVTRTVPEFGAQAAGPVGGTGAAGG